MSGGWYETVASEVAHRGTFAHVRVDRVRMPDGAVADREVVEQADAVAVVPLLDDGTVVLLRQYRHPVGRYLLEIPAGKLDVSGESPEAAARRELVEEIHHSAENLRHLLTIQNSAGWTDEHTHLYLGTGLRRRRPPGEYSPAPEEADMEVVRVPLSEALAWVDAGRISDAKTALGLLLVARTGGGARAGPPRDGG